MSTIFASAMPRSWSFWRTEPPAPEQQPESNMSATLRKLGRGPNGAIVLKAYTDYLNYAVPLLMDEDAISERILKTMRKPYLDEGKCSMQLRKALAPRKENRREGN